MARLADGDPDAFDGVFDALWPLLFAYCKKALHEAADAEDAAQRALIKMLENAPHYDRDRPARAWALGFAFWECRSERTRRRRKNETLEAELETTTTPEQLAMDKQELEVLDAVLAPFSETERALILGEVESSVTQLAGVSGPTLRKRRQRLLGRLREAAAALIAPNKGES